MSSINPVLVLLPQRSRRAVKRSRAGFVASLTLGAGQFCTNPGLILVPEGGAGGLRSEGVGSIVGLSGGAHAHPRNRTRTNAASSSLLRTRGLRPLRADNGGTGVNRGRTALFSTDAQSFLADEALKQEVFGASSLLIRCRDTKHDAGDGGAHGGPAHDHAAAGRGRPA